MRREGLFPLTEPIVARINDANNTVVLSFVATNPAMRASVDATLVGTFVDRSPRARFEVASSFECSSPGGSFVDLDGSASSDPEGGALEYRWFLDGRPRALTATARLFVPLGDHTVGLLVKDPSGIVDLHKRSVTVIDSTPPAIANASAEPACLWPPNHKLALYRLGHELSATVVDACDPSASLQVAGVVDSEAVFGGTSGDVAWGSGAVCVRSEKSALGARRAVREYSVRLRAVSATGPSSEATVVIGVPHDQGGVKCRGPAPASVADGDPRCVADESTQVGAQGEPEPGAEAVTDGAASSESVLSPAAGCAAVPGGALLWLLALVALRRSALQTGR